MRSCSEARQPHQMGDFSSKSNQTLHFLQRILQILGRTTVLSHKWPLKKIRHENMAGGDSATCSVFYVPIQTPLFRLES